MIATLFTGGFDVQKLGGKPLHDILHSAFDNGLGLVGFGEIRSSKQEMLLLTQAHLQHPS